MDIGKIGISSPRYANGIFWIIENNNFIADEHMDLSLISQLSRTLGAKRSHEDLVRQLLSMLEMVTDLESTYLTRVDVEAGEQQILFSRNSKALNIPEGLTVPWNDTLCKRALEEGRTCTNGVPSVWGDSQAAQALGIVTYVSSPVTLDDGSLYGTLCAASSDRKPLSDNGEQVLRMFAELIAQNVWKDQLLDSLNAANTTLESYSYSDALTGLHNRRGVMQEFERLFAVARNARQSVRLAFIDLDGFKQINDQYGHETGDQFLMQVGRRLKHGARQEDAIGRLGGDEFVVARLEASSDADGEAAQTSTRERLNKLLIGKFELGEHVIDYGGASIGVVLADPESSGPEQALREADAAMYLEKKKRHAARAR